MTSRSVICFSLLILALWSPSGAAHHCATPSPSVGAKQSPSPSPTSSPPPWHKDRYFFFSNTAPITSTLKAVDGFPDKVSRTLDKLRQTEDAILKAQRDKIQTLTKSRLRGQRTRHALQSLLPTCNSEDTAWFSAAKSMIEAVFNRTTWIPCVTDVFPEGEEELEWYDVISQFRQALNDSAALINEQAEARFANPDTVYNFPHETGTERCLINAIGAFRVDDSWFVNVAITNELKSHHLGDRKRYFLVELMGRDGTHANMTLGVIPPAPSPDPAAYYRRSDASTLSVDHIGPASPDFFKPTLFENNIALARALEKSQLYMQQAHEARSASSIAILFLPLFLNILPIALFADVSRLIMLFYALLSDVLTTLPLAIKGIELILTGSERNVGVVVRMTSFHDGTRMNESAAEVYVASCQPSKGVVNAGITFLVIAMVFLVVGLVLEVVARQRVQGWRRKLM